MTGIDRHRAVLELAAELVAGDEGRHAQGVATLAWLGRPRFREIRGAALRAMAEAD